jgi:hypothetical protein
MAARSDPTVDTLMTHCDDSSHLHGYVQVEATSFNEFGFTRRMTHQRIGLGLY